MQPKVKDWKLGKLNHVAIAVPDLEKASQLYRDVLGANVSDVVVSLSPTARPPLKAVPVRKGKKQIECVYCYSKLWLQDDTLILCSPSQNMESTLSL